MYFKASLIRNRHDDMLSHIEVIDCHLVHNHPIDTVTLLTLAGVKEQLIELQAITDESICDSVIDILESTLEKASSERVLSATIEYGMRMDETRIAELKEFNVIRSKLLSLDDQIEANSAVVMLLSAIEAKLPVTLKLYIQKVLTKEIRLVKSNKQMDLFELDETFPDYDTFIKKYEEELLPYAKVYKFEKNKKVIVAKKEALKKKFKHAKCDMGVGFKFEEKKKHLKINYCNLTHSHGSDNVDEALSFEKQLDILERALLESNRGDSIAYLEAVYNGLQEKLKVAATLTYGFENDIVDYEPEKKRRRIDSGEIDKQTDTIENVEQLIKLEIAGKAEAKWSSDEQKYVRGLITYYDDSFNTGADDFKDAANYCKAVDMLQKATKFMTLRSEGKIAFLLL